MNEDNLMPENVVEETDIIEETEVAVAVKKARTKFVVDEAHVSLLLKTIEVNGGMTAGQLTELTGLDGKELKALLKHLRKAEVIKMEGTKRGARYFTNS